MSMRWRGTAVVLAATVVLEQPSVASGFIEDILNQAFGGGGGQQQFFQMGGGDMFGMGGGHRQQQPKWPRGVSDKITKKFNWMKGTEWNWNNWRNVKFNRDGTFDAPTRDCQGGMCKWSASKGKVFILWGEAGLHELTLQGEAPETQDPNKLAGKRLVGVRVSDGERCVATFAKIFDFEAAELDKDLYEALGLQDDAGEAEIKKAYRKLSIKYHPDKNPDAASQQLFKDVRDAYEILNDPDKKILYDTGGMEAVKKSDKGEVSKTDDIPSPLEVTLEDLYNSGSRKAELDRRVVCRACSSKPDRPVCRGCGRCPNEVRMENRQVGPGMIMQQQVEVPSKEKCKQENTVLEVHIEKGMKEGETIRFDRMAEQRPGMLPGAVIFTLKQKKHNRYVRRGDDLHMDMKISLNEALLGWTQKMRHMDGHILEFGTTSPTKPFQVIKVAGEGMPLRDDPASFGNLYVKVEVEFPKTLSEEQRNLARSMLGEPRPRPDL